MSDPRKTIRQRVDVTALHTSGVLDGTTTSERIRIDIVAQVVTIQLESTLTADADGSLDGINFFTLGSFSSGRLTYGKGASDHLVKHVRITRTAGSGRAAIFAV